jgi:hypothetical protein
MIDYSSIGEVVAVQGKSEAIAVEVVIHSPAAAVAVAVGQGIVVSFLATIEDYLYHQDCRCEEHS